MQVQRRFRRVAKAVSTVLLPVKPLGAVAARFGSVVWGAPQPTRPAGPATRPFGLLAPNRRVIDS